MKYINLCFSLMFITALSFGQSDLVFKELKQNMSKGSKCGTQVTLENTNPKEVEKAIRDIMVDFKAKVAYGDKEKLELFSDDAYIPAMSDKVVDIYSQIVPNGTAVVLTNFYTIDTVFMCSDSGAKKYEMFLLINKRIVGKLLANKTELRIDSAGKFQSALESNMKALLNDKDKMNASIDKSKKAISDNESDIRANMTSISTVAAKIDAKNVEVNKAKEVVTAVNKTGIESQIKVLESDIKDIISANEKSNKSMIDKKTELDKLKVALAPDAKSKEALKNQQAITKVKLEMDNLDLTLKTNEAALNSKKAEKDKLQLSLANSNLEEKEKALKDRQTELKKIESEKEKLEKDSENKRAAIQENKNNISTQEDNLKKNAEEIIAKQAEIDKAKKSVDILRALQTEYLNFK